MKQFCRGVVVELTLFCSTYSDRQTDKYQFPNAVEVTTADSVAWQAAIAKIITDEQSRLPHQHLISQNIANFRLRITRIPG